MSGKLFIVATPIGNLKDITLRALETLKEVDIILCEDTRVTQKLLQAYDIKKQLISFHQHSSNMAKIVELLKEGKNLALVSDAGTPGINDPGGKLIQEVVFSDIGAEIIPIPGPSALSALISVSGIAMDEFIYKGFIPHKKGRETLFKEIGKSEVPTVLFESVHRIEKTLDQMAKFFPETKRLIVGRELTKMHETIYRGTLLEVTEKIKNDPIKGEFVIIVY